MCLSSIRMFYIKYLVPVCFPLWHAVLSHPNDLSWNKILINSGIGGQDLMIYHYTAIIKSQIGWDLERTFKSPLVQLCNEKIFNLITLPRAPIQPSLECFQERGIYNLSGQSVQVVYHPHWKNSFIYVVWLSPSLRLKPLSLVLALQTLLYIRALIYPYMHTHTRMN